MTEAGSVATSPTRSDARSPRAAAFLRRRRPTSMAIARLGWGVADQAVSSLSNFALGLYVARSLGAAGFGAFSLAYLTYTVVLNASRGTATDPLLVRFSGAGRRRWRRATSAAAATALAVGSAAGLVSLAAGLVLPHPLGLAFLALAVGLPGLMLQDSWRFAFFAQGRGSRAFANDVVWTVLLVLALLVLQRSGQATVATCLLAFGGTASLAAAVGVLQAGLVPRGSLVGGWLRDHRDLSTRYLVENVSVSAASQIRSFALGALGGLAAVGYLRGAEILMGPFVVVLMGISQVAVPEASRAFQSSAERLLRFCLAVGTIQAGAAVAWGLGLVLVLPLGPGRALLDDLWSGTQPLLPAVALNVAAACFLTAALAGLRAMGVARRSLRVQLVTAVAYISLSAGGAAVAGALGACWGAMAANSLGALVGWFHLRSALVEHRGGNGFRDGGQAKADQNG